MPRADRGYDQKSGEVLLAHATIAAKIPSANAKSSIAVVPQSETKLLSSPSRRKEGPSAEGVSGHGRAVSKKDKDRNAILEVCRLI